ncbi:MAG: hypothetical protein IBX44_07190 [Sulfurospirillum sp.]|nr:hypothetical protein [Sulfurospirillum sp.]
MALHSPYLLQRSKLNVQMQKLTCKKTFMQLNAYMLFIVAYLIIDKWIF